MLQTTKLTRHIDQVQHYLARLMKGRFTRIAGILFIGVLAILASTLLLSNAVATPLQPPEARLQGWVSDLRQDALTSRRQEAQRQLEAAGETAVPALLTALRSNDSIQRRNAAEMLGYIASPTAGAALSEALRNDAIPTVRRNAAWALGEIASPTYWNDLQHASVLDSSASVRQTAQDSLARVKGAIANSAGVDETAVNAIAVAPSQVQTVYVATKRDLVLSHDGGNRWDTLSQALPSLVSTLTVSPNDPNTIYAGMDSLGMYVSADGGKSWLSLTQEFSNQAIGSSTVTAIAVDPSNARHLIIAHGIRLGTQNVEFVSLGILNSLDGGKTWQPLSDVERDQTISRLTVRDNKVYALAQDHVLIIPFQGM